MEKRLYPFKFAPIASRRPWGGTLLADKLGKKFFEKTEDGSRNEISRDEIIGESWEISDMGEQDSVITNGWLEGNGIGEVMETFMERVTGEKVFDAYGTQFPLLIKFLDIEGKLSVQVHPDDTVAMQRYDSLGKTEVWLVLDAAPESRIYMGFKEKVEPADFYKACKNGTADKFLNVIHPSKGDVIFIKPGTVHAAEGGILICEIQESSDMTFRLYDWGRELNPATARKMHLEEAFDIIDFGKYDSSNYTPAASRSTKDGSGKTNRSVAVADCPFFTVTEMELHKELKVNMEDLDSFITYSCIKGEVTLEADGGDGTLQEYRLSLGESILVPAECRSFTLTPLVDGSRLIAAVTRPEEEKDSYTN